MPIKKENKNKYPKNWKEISNRIRFERAEGRCECELELFARERSPLFPKREGWDVWGNEIENDINLVPKDA